jgi:hypothetical protein
VSRIALVKPEKARGVENMVIAMAQRGQITEPVRSGPCAATRPACACVACVRRRSARRQPRETQVTDALLLGMLEKVNEQMPKTGVTVRQSLAQRAQCCTLTRCPPQINRRRPSLFEDD